MVRKSSGWIPAGVLTSVVVASFAGCSDEGKPGQGNGASNVAPDGAVTDARAASAGGRAGSGGSTAATGGSTATAGGSGGIVDASLDDSGDRGTGGHASVPPPPQQDAGPTPPPYCVAPCVWEVVKHCIPELHSCVQMPATGISATLTCDPTTGWSEYSGLVASKTFKFSVSYEGAECFRRDSGGIPGLFVASFVDGRGNVVATQITGEPLYCGATLNQIESAHMSGHVPDAGIELGDGGFAPAYQMDPTRPECAAWDENGLPVRPPCDVTDGGVCP